jgi:DNA-binding NarL/FixJ family response regulator
MAVATKILIVEDHRVFSEALELLLGQRLLKEHADQPEFRRAATVAEGLGLIHEEGPFYIAVVDSTLPDGNGSDLLGEIKALHPETRVAMLSPARDLSGELNVEADDVIGKGTPYLEMISRLARLAA